MVPVLCTRLLTVVYVVTLILSSALLLLSLLMRVSCSVLLIYLEYAWVSLSLLLQLFEYDGYHHAEGARNALSLAGTMLGYYPVRVLPSKTAIAPVNPTFLPRVKNLLTYPICRLQKLGTSLHYLMTILY